MTVEALLSASVRRVCGYATMELVLEFALAGLLALGHLCVPFKAAIQMLLKQLTVIANNLNFPIDGKGTMATHHLRMNIASRTIDTLER